MLTDRPEVYETDRVEAARRTAPVLVTRPGQVYDLDPTKTDRLWMVQNEVSGAGPRPFEADQRMQQTLYQLDIARPFERWTVLARTAGAPTSLAVGELGLDATKEYLGFDFWEHRAVGVFTGTLRLPPVEENAVEVVCLRERVDHPQLLATNRHVSCGGVDLQSVVWNGSALTGESRVVGGDEYVLYVTESSGWEAVSVEADGTQAQLGLVSDEAGVRVRRVVVKSAASRVVNWTLKYHRAP
jgi:hypothetical protein